MHTQKEGKKRKKKRKKKMTATVLVFLNQIKTHKRLKGMLILIRQCKKNPSFVSND